MKALSTHTPGVPFADGSNDRRQTGRLANRGLMAATALFGRWSRCTEFGFGLYADALEESGW